MIDRAILSAAGVAVALVVYGCAGARYVVGKAGR